MAKWIAPALLACLAGQESFVGKEPPELKAEKAQWVGSEKALTLADLKGKVVWLEFGVLG